MTIEELKDQQAKAIKNGIITGFLAIMQLLLLILAFIAMNKPGEDSTIYFVGSIIVACINVKK